MPQHFMEQILESGLFDEKDVREYDQQDPADKDWDNTVDHWENILDAMERFERGAGRTSKKARFENENAAYIKDRIQMAKEEALAEMRAEQAVARKQDTEEANILINLLQGSTNTQAKEATTSSSSLEAIMAVQEDMKKQITALKRQNQALVSASKSASTTSSTRPSAVKDVTPATPSTAASTGHALNSAGQGMSTKANIFGEKNFVEEQLCANCNKKRHHLPSNSLHFHPRQCAQCGGAQKVEGGEPQRIPPDTAHQTSVGSGRKGGGMTRAGAAQTNTCRQNGQGYGREQ